MGINRLRDFVCKHWKTLGNSSPSAIDWSRDPKKVEKGWRKKNISWGPLQCVISGEINQFISSIWTFPTMLHCLSLLSLIACNCEFYQNKFSPSPPDTCLHVCTLSHFTGQRFLPSLVMKWPPSSGLLMSSASTGEEQRETWKI